MVLLWILLILLLLFAIFWVFSLHGIRRKPGFYGFEGEHYAHRGLYANDRGLPENSLRAFRVAAKAGYGAELDVHLSKDGKLVVMHDENLQRMCGIDCEICDMTADELDQCRLLGTDEKIPYLEEVLPIFSKNYPLIIEIKTKGANAARLTGKVCALLRKYPDVKFCIESFDPRVLMWLKKHQPKIIRGQLSCNFFKTTENLSWFLKLILTNLTMNFLSKPHFIAYKLEDRDQLSFRLCRKVWDIQEISWTVQTPEDEAAAIQDHRLIIFEGFLPQ